MSIKKNSVDKKEIVDWMRILEDKPTVEELTDIVYHDSQWIPILFEIIKKDKGSTKYICDKVIRKISENDPIQIYPYFNDVAELIESSNSFIKWGAIITLSNLIAVDDECKFETVYERYFDLIQSDAMITAANVVGNAWKIVKKYPQYEKNITQRLLKVTKNIYLNKGEPSPECQRILCGHVLASFEKYFELSSETDKMIDFAKNLTNCTRKAVATKARTFLKNHGADMA